MTKTSNCDLYICARRRILYTYTVWYFLVYNCTNSSVIITIRIISLVVVDGIV